MKVKIILFLFIILFYQKAYSSNSDRITISIPKSIISLPDIVHMYLFSLENRVKNGEMPQILDEIGNLPLEENGDCSILLLIIPFLMYPKMSFINQDVIDSLEELMKRTFSVQDKNTVLKIQALLRNKDTFRQLISYMITENLIPLYFQNHFIQCLGSYPEKWPGTSYGDCIIFGENTISDFYREIDALGRHLLLFIWVFQATQGKKLSSIRINLTDFFQNIGNDLMKHSEAKSN